MQITDFATLMTALVALSVASFTLNTTIPSLSRGKPFIMASIMPAFAVYTHWKCMRDKRREFVGHHKLDDAEAGDRW